MKVIVLGGDGFCGWPCAVNLAEQNHEVIIVDNLSRRKIDIDLEVESLTPISSHAESRSVIEAIGVKDSTSRSISIFLRLKLSTIITS